jgi:thiol:disulfide interchange protein DsbA
MAIFSSFSTRAKVQQANQLMDTYGVNGVPTIVVGGTYQTSPSLAKGEERTTAVIEYLVAKMRGGH